MDLSLVYRVGRSVAGVFALLCFAVLAGTVAYVGLGVSARAWENHPEHAWLALVGALGLMYFLTQAGTRRRSRARTRDDEDEDGGQRLRVPPRPPQPPAPAPVDWREFDTLREDWATPPTRAPAGVQ